MPADSYILSIQELVLLFSERLSFDEVIYEIFRLGKRKARRRVLHR